jgi:hypothetical protein
MCNAVVRLTLTFLLLQFSKTCLENRQTEVDKWHGVLLMDDNGKATGVSYVKSLSRNIR